MNVSESRREGYFIVVHGGFAIDHPLDPSRNDRVALFAAGKAS
jgi:hypothetical protein